MERELILDRADRILDSVIATALLAFGLVNIWVLSPSELYVFLGSQVAHSFFLVALCAALAARRRAPVVVAAAVVAVSMTWHYALGDATREPPFESFLALLFAAYTVGAWTNGRRFLAGVVALGLLIPLELPSLLDGRPAGDAFPAWLFTAFFVVVGRFVGHQRDLSKQLREQSAVLAHEQSERERLAAAFERSRLARELHDVVTHNVSLMVIQASVERRALGPGTSDLHRTLRTLEELGRETLAELRRLVGAMRSDGERPTLLPQPTLDELPDLVARTRDAGLDVELVIEGTVRQVPAGIGLAAYRIAQEALTNTLQHADALHAALVVRYGRSSVDVELLDDGTAPAGHESASGNGLTGMRERAQLYGGTVEAGSIPDGGYRVRATLPTSEGSL